MSVAVETDNIDDFIRQQKQKLARERHDLDLMSRVWRALKEEPSREPRKTWDKQSSNEDRVHKLAEEIETSRVKSPEGKGLPGGRNSVEAKRKKLQEERRREYNELLQKKPVPGNRRLATPQGRSLPVGRGQDVTVDKRKALQEERAKEYNQMLSQHPQSTRRRPPTPEESGLPIGHYAEQKKKLEAERVHEYNDLLEKPPAMSTRPQFKDDDMSPAEFEYLKQKILEERERSYQREILRREKEIQSETAYNTAKKGYHSSRKENLPPKPATPNGFLNRLGGHEQRKKKLDEERKKEYNQLLEEKAKRGKAPPARAGETMALPGMQEPMTDEKPRGRQEEPARQQPDPYYGTLPGLGYSNSAKKHTFDPEVDDPRWQRDQRPGAPRKGWGTPTYEEILEKKRQEENRYRRYDDPEYQRPGMRSYASEGALLSLDPQRRPDDYDRKPAPRGQYQDKGILNDDDWLRPQADLYDARLREDRLREPPPQQARAHPPPVNATLLIDHRKAIGIEERTSAKRRKREAYRDELQNQMKEDVQKRKWEKNQEVRVNATGLLDPEKRPDRLRGLPPASEPPRRPEPDYRSASTKPITSLLDQLSPRTEAILGRRSAAPELHMPGGRDGGILERGWGELYERPRPSIRPAPDVGYQNSSYLTTGAGPYSAVDEAYQFYGMRNPLELESYNDAPRVSHDPNPTSARVKFEDPSYSPRKPEPRRSGLPFPVEEEDGKKTKSKQEVQSYQVELQRQIEEQRMKKQREKQEQDRMDKKWEEENKNYNPFGRGGGGAPMRDSAGNAVADLRHMRTNTDPDAPKETPRAPQPVSPRYVANTPPPSMAGQGEGTHARGGHGIFGIPKTEEEKTVSDRYKDDLRLQIEDKKRRDAEEKAKIREEEERENRKIQDQQDRIQREFEEELRKKREKEEEANRRNEEMKRLAEERRKEAEAKKKESEERRLHDLRDRQEEERLERERERMKNQRSSSPPVPAVKNKNKQSAEDRGKSPVVPALRKNSAPTPPQSQPAPRTEEQEKPQQRASSADVLNQLAAMRRQLQNERLRVENALDQQKNDYEVFDPRLVQRPPVAPRREPEVDIFEGARNRAPVSVRRAPVDNADLSNVQEFNYLKNKADTDSRRDFRSSFPEQPVTNDDLETQQLALIRKQEEYRRDRPARSVYEQALPHMQPKDLGLMRKESLTPQALLQSDSAFIEVNGVDQYPEDFDDLPRRNVSARQRRREKTPSPRYNPDNFSLGSNVSLDADRISKKNEERLKRLKQMSDETSLADPDDVLDRFMAKQKHNRPPSGQTLRDDTWMRPGSK